MNNAQLYLAWLRTVAPTVYTQALRQATGQSRTLGGLADDLVQQSFAPDIGHSFLGDDTSSLLDPITVNATYMDAGAPITTNFSASDFATPSFDTSSVAAPSMVAIDTGTAALPSAPAPAGTSSIFGNVLASVAALGVGVLNYSNQSKLIQLNTTRAQQGLPPVDASGRVVNTAGFSTTSPTLLAFERAISGGSGSMLLPILAILGIGAFFVFRGKSA